MQRESPRRPRVREPRAPYAGARVEELEEPLLPRWFVLLLLAAIPVAIGVAIWAFVVFGTDEVPAAERRPPPSADGSLTTNVGGFNVGELAPERLSPSCGFLQGIRAAGTGTDRERIATAVEALCEVRLPTAAGPRLGAFADAGGVVRFAQFQATGVDSSMEVSGDPPRILLNARFARDDTDPLWIAPLLVHDTTYLELSPGSASAALEAREHEAAVCAELFAESRPSRACEDAAAVLELLDPLRALESAGFLP